jgi:6-phosphofructokinase
MEQKLAVVVGGGPAPGINGVISAVTFEAGKQGLEVVCIRGGSRWLSKGGAAKSLTNRCAKHLVSLVGCDTAFSTARVEQETGGKIAVRHVPKTINNDPPLPHGVPAFGFETTRMLTQREENCTGDARTAGRRYYGIAMGRSAGHPAPGMGMGAGATLTLILNQVEMAGGKIAVCHVKTIDDLLFPCGPIHGFETPDKSGMLPGISKFGSEHSAHGRCALIIPPPLHESIIVAETQKHGYVIRSWDTAGRYGHA